MVDYKEKDEIHVKGFVTGHSSLESCVGFGFRPDPELIIPAWYVPKSAIIKHIPRQEEIEKGDTVRIGITELIVEAVYGKELWLRTEHGQPSTYFKDSATLVRKGH